MIKITNLHKTYGAGRKAVTALKGVDLSIQSGMFGLLGPNGAGKTTLMRIIAGIVNPTQGTVIVNGHNMVLESDRRIAKSDLGYLPQELGLYPDLTARQFIDYLAILKGVANKKERTDNVSKVIDMVGLRDQADRLIKGYSGGMKRRVGIAQALVNDPRVLIVDEPTAGLDPEERIRFRNLLVELAVDRIVILSTHIVDDIGQTCQNMAVLSDGAIRFQGNPRDITKMAENHVWNIITPNGVKPDGGLTVVSTQHLSEGITYRVVGKNADEYKQAQKVQPSLEDGYMWLMKSNISW